MGGGPRGSTFSGWGARPGEPHWLQGEHSPCEPSHTATWPPAAPGVASEHRSDCVPATRSSHGVLKTVRAPGGPRETWGLGPACLVICLPLSSKGRACSSWVPCCRTPPPRLDLPVMPALLLGLALPFQSHVVVTSSGVTRPSLQPRATSRTGPLLLASSPSGSACAGPRCATQGEG